MYCVACLCVTAALYPAGLCYRADLRSTAPAKILPYYKGYFGSAYPLPKLDLIAIPDFASGEDLVTGQDD